ncbi:MAG: diaminopimelate epimerase [Desulfovibrionaceae bacterium]|nr:diaminopimelate epimerase [Desulfovibrionaceae bacterium]
MSEIFGQSVRFHKMQGCGNDFVVIDNRGLNVPAADMPDWAVKVCRRAFGVGADGLFFLEPAPKDSGLDYRWRFFNSDGSRPEMCGNASRCAARLAHALGLAGEVQVFGTDAGPIKARVFPGTDQVKVQLPRPRDVRLNLELEVNGEAMSVHFANTGVPHVAVFVRDVSRIDVPTIGAAIRFHPEFAPAGTNVNFVQVKDPAAMLVRTYERGVEAETYACGTGVSAAQVLANALGLTGPEARATTSGGETLAVSLESGELFLTGSAQLVFSGELFLEPLGLKLP